MSDGYYGSPNIHAELRDENTRVARKRAASSDEAFGSIDYSGVRVRAAYAAYHVERRFAAPNVKIADPNLARER